MHRVTVCSVITAFALAAGACSAQSQTAPPIKPGLWQVHSEREVNGQKVADANDRMKNMSPEKRARFEAMMKEHGVETDAPGMSKVCQRWATRFAVPRTTMTAKWLGSDCGGLKPVDPNP